MVSFQCDGCNDVVKKPKLDQHHSRGCRASFTCIDCSKTFPTPADWKGHTSCISESQKYEKSLYRPKANGGGRDVPAGVTTGKFQGQGGSWGRPPLGRPRWQATGANGTPLGTPTRMSPVTVSPPAEEQKSTVTPAIVNTTEAAKEKEKKAHKKRKLDREHGTASEALEPDGSGEKEEPKAKEKKEKKEKKAKKEKKDKHKEAAAETVVGDGNTGETEDATRPSSSVAVDLASGDTAKKPKKSKKDKRRKDETMDAAQDESGDAIVVDSPANGDDDNEKKKKKKKKQKPTDPEAEAAPDADASVADIATPVQKKTKKRKREADGETEVAKDIEMSEGEAENGKKSKKKKKVSAS